MLAGDYAVGVEMLSGTQQEMEISDAFCILSVFVHLEFHENLKNCRGRNFKEIFSIHHVKNIARVVQDFQRKFRRDLNFSSFPVIK